MPDTALDIGALLHRHAHEPLTSEQRRAVRDLSACRTAQLGGRIEQCSACGHRDYLYNSCGNRHCPKCQAGCRATWLEREASYLLPVEYHHLVFTLPHKLALLGQDNPRLVYGLLFTAASQTVLTVAARPKYLGAQVGLTAVLHTWGQTLSLHPHLHLLATGGGLSCNERGVLDAEPVWRRCRPGFFLPVRLLSAVFQSKFLAALRQAYEQGHLRLRGAQASLTEPAQWTRWLQGLSDQPWVVYSQPPSAGAEVVLKYLARYTYRVALSNSRLVQVTDETVTFRYKDYRQAGRSRELTLTGAEFARRFLQHVLPLGFVRVRHYGLLANRGREDKLGTCRRLLFVEGPQQAVATTVLPASAPVAETPRRCAACDQGRMYVIEVLPRPQKGAVATRREDSS